MFKRRNVRRDDVQAEALARQAAYLAAKRGTTPRPTSMTRCEYANQEQRAGVRRQG